MFIAIIIVFVLGYTVIALEHPMKINKSATALFLAVLLWVLFMVSGETILVNPTDYYEYLAKHPDGTFWQWLSHVALLEHLGEISEIIFFLMGAMTIVELTDGHQGFRVITDRIKTTNKVKLIWIVSFITFFLSAALDNLTTSIVMIALLRKLIADKHERWFYGGMVILAANAGGAWSPIGDVTTIMLWIGGQVTTLNIIIKIIVPSILAMIVPLLALSFIMKGNVTRPEVNCDDNLHAPPVWQRNLIFIMGVSGLLFVPIFKTLTHLPPYLGMLGSLSVLWIVTEILHHKSESDEFKSHCTVVGVLKKIDVPSILFFLGILLAVSALQSIGHLELLAETLDENVGNLSAITMIIGVLSSVVDNVPLVAGAMGMYDLSVFPVDHYFWEMLAYCAGTGGSILIIGSAAGVAVMGMEKIDFIWYLKKISLWALLGYVAGAFSYILMDMYIFHTPEVDMEHLEQVGHMLFR
jgi:Na+/H+ antiporter NhaD/arsenite permease-like protein